MLNTYNNILNYLKIHKSILKQCWYSSQMYFQQFKFEKFTKFSV